MITNQKDILSETKQFYQNLFSDKSLSTESDCNNYLNKTKHVILSNADLDGTITFHETLETHNKSPGPDGFSVEFFECF